MSDKVVDITGAPVGPIVEVAYDRQLIEMLESLITDIKRGRIDGVAFVATCTEPTSDVEYNYFGRRLTLLSGLSRLAHRINTHLDGSNETTNQLGA